MTPPPSCDGAGAPNVRDGGTAASVGTGRGPTLAPWGILGRAGC